MSKRRGVGRKDSCIVPFHFVSSGALVAGSFVFLLNPAAFPRVLAEADAWAHFRVRSLRFRLLPTSPITGAQVIGYVGGVQDTSPTTLVQVSELIPSAGKGVGQTVPTEWVVVPKMDLAGPFPWYKTVVGAADATEESPGLVTIAGTGTDAVISEYRGVFEFKTSVATANTPLALSLRKRIHEERTLNAIVAQRTLLMRILSTGTPPAVSSV